MKMVADIRLLHEVIGIYFVTRVALANKFMVMYHVPKISIISGAGIVQALQYQIRPEYKIRNGNL